MEFFHHSSVGTSSRAHTNAMARWNLGERKKRKKTFTAR
jgi:hypothetical protein